ncbi:hypothetical protein ACTFIV_010394 [Dictyostelium citrinum]
MNSRSYGSSDEDNLKNHDDYSFSEEYESFSSDQAIEEQNVEGPGQSNVGANQQQQHEREQDRLEITITPITEIIRRHPPTQIWSIGNYEKSHFRTTYCCSSANSSSSSITTTATNCFILPLQPLQNLLLSTNYNRYSSHYGSTTTAPINGSTTVPAITMTATIQPLVQLLPPTAPKPVICSANRNSACDASPDPR